MSNMPDVSESQQSYTSTSQASNASDGPLTLKATDTGAGVLNTPLVAVTITETSGQTYGIAEKDTERYKRLREESLGWLVGTMPVPAFLNAFLGGDRVDLRKMPRGRNMFKDYLVDKKGWPRTEKEIQTVIINAMHDVFFLEDGTETTRCPGFTFCDTSGYPDELNPNGRFGAVKPDICLYADDHLPKIKNGIKRPEDKYSDMGFSALHFEVKSAPGADFFQDLTPETNHKGTRREFNWIVNRGDENVSVTQFNNARRNLGQTVAYAVEGCKRQHRRHYFSVSVSGKLVRFIRWDRAGAVVTEAFSVLDYPDLFCEFFWRFAHITDAERGYDLTVEPATEEQEEIFRQAIQRHVIAQLEGDADTSDSVVQTALEEHYQRNAVTVIHLPHSPHFYDPDLKGHHLLVSRPVAVPLSVAGRSTRTYWAVDSRTGKVVLLKDTWRYDTIRVDPESGEQRVEREGDILEAMKDSVSNLNIPKVVHQEDVPDFTIDADSIIEYDRGDVFFCDFKARCNAQTTQTQDYVDADWACGAAHRTHVIVKRIHYRLVLDVAGYTLLRLRGTSELLHGARDAFRALQGAFSKEGRFHRDITPGHIILYKGPGTLNRKGYLVDWDLSRVVGDEGYLEDFQVSSTWQFLSIIMYLPYKAAPNRVRDLLKQMFDVYAMTEGGYPYGGFGKSRNKTQRAFTFCFKWKSRSFKKWLDAIMEIHQLDTNWNPEAVGDWWDGFLAKYGATLPLNDRQNNILSAGKQIARSDWEAPQHVKGAPQPSTRTSPLFLPPELNPARKRDAEAANLSDPGEDDEAAPPEKQRRTCPDEIWSSDSHPYVLAWEPQPWRDGPPIYSATTSTSTTPMGHSEESLDTGGTDDGRTPHHMYGHFLTPDLARMLHQLGEQHADVDEEVTRTPKDRDVKGKGPAVR
ncbi:hypothetical protein GSI_07194 [Ganoderma sinense ZZ0214-1]|uniref:Fungal-type protein kinase domain-containing protein n=1 Tax=Ganoderma sinense ZZ0214-1 TaxID=1077348 RepID=A0A2G8S9R5_9APHY|nr:hypothetical protein GSI_07194 [Ganoderma sinense ZZ0214-1]